MGSQCRESERGGEMEHTIRQTHRKIVKARKLGLVGRIFLAASAAGTLFSGGCVGEEGGFLDPYAVGGAALEGLAPYSKSEGAGLATAITGRAVSRSGDYMAAERAAAVGRTEVNVYGNGENNGGSGISNDTSQPSSSEPTTGTTRKVVNMKMNNGETYTGSLIAGSDGFSRPHGY